MKQSITARISNSINENICRLIGHNWRYKDYSNYMKPNGDTYDFTASRNCKRCRQHAYFYSSWKNETKSILDFENTFDSFLVAPRQLGNFFKRA